MAVQFILGRSGTGKTTWCVNGIVGALLESTDQPLIFLVPEQATYQAERSILADERIAGFHRLHVLSFDRLQFLLVGKNTARPRVSQIGRQMIVHKILRDVQGDLKVFQSSALLPGFARQMAELVTELHRYAQGPDEVDDLVAQLAEDESRRLTELKFADVALVFRRYAELLEGRFVDPEAQLMDACRCVGKSELVRGARLWVDGFASFTGGELAFLMEMLRAVDHAQIALCLDPAAVNAKMGRNDPPSPDGLFEPTERTYFDLLEQVGQARLAVEPAVHLEKPARFWACRPLAHVEGAIFRPDAKQTEAGDAIRLVAAPNLRGEIQFVARQIRDLVQGGAHRYREIAVVASDLGRYEQYVRAYFEDYGIPFFIDSRKALNQHPVVELICTALAVVIDGFASADVFAYLKTGLVPIEPTLTDALENYCLAFGVDGRDWLDQKPWRFKAPNDETFNEDAINRTRDRARTPLLTLRAALCPDGDTDDAVTPGDFVRAVWQLLDALHVREAMGDWIDEARERGDPGAAEEHRQFFDRLLDIFDELVDVFGADRMTASDYIGLLHAAFAQMTLALIPPRLDQVLVGSIERSRHPNLKAVFLLGATQKQFPVPVPAGGLLTDEDRDASERGGLHLAPSSTQSLIERQYLAYIAFTRPSERLCVSYPAVDEMGSPVVRSHFVEELQSLFNDVEEEVIAETTAGPADVRTEAELAELFCCRLGRDASEFEAKAAREPAALLDALSSDPDFGSLARSVAIALHYENRAELEANMAQTLFAGDLRSSATRLGAFAACPYKYFARYTLALNPRREFKLQPLDLGSFYHRVLDATHKQLVAEDRNFGTADDARLLAVVREQIAELTAHEPFISNFVKHSGHNAFVISQAAETLEEAVLEIAQMVRAGSFRPYLAEVGFGQARDARETLGALELPLPDGRRLVLNGKIDRLDVAEIDEQKVALVLDYKRSPAQATFKWSPFFYGLDVQLPLYLLAIAEAGNSPIDRVAGAFYMPVESVAERGTLDELPKKTDRFGRRAKGLFCGAYAENLDPDATWRGSRFYNFAVTKEAEQYGFYPRSGALKPSDFESVLNYTREKIVSLATGVLAGRIEAHPFRLGTQAACAYCDYRAVCRFDWQINDYHDLVSKNKLDVVGEEKRT